MPSKIAFYQELLFDPFPPLREINEPFTIVLLLGRIIGARSKKIHNVRRELWVRDQVHWVRLKSI
jgi:hypothetical protein